MSSPNNHVGTVLAVFIATLILSGLVLGLRLYARTVVRKGSLGLDDLFILIAWLAVLVYDICMFVSISHGYGQRKIYLSTEDMIQVVKFEVIGQVFGILSFVPGKISVCICLARIFPSRKLRALLAFVGVFNGLGFAAAGILTIAQCAPGAKQWDASLPGQCIDPEVNVYLNLVAGAFGAAADVVLALIPWYYIRSLQMKRREKVAVGFAMSLGIFAGCFGIAKCYYLMTLGSRADYAYDTIPLILWTAGEQCAIIIAASIPMLRPLLQQLSFLISRSLRSSRDSSGRGLTRSIAKGGRKRSQTTGTESANAGLMDSRNNAEGGIWIDRLIERIARPTSISQTMVTMELPAASFPNKNAGYDFNVREVR